jgi:hypothetical protein
MNRRDLAAFLGSPQAIREYEQSLASYTLTDLDNGYDNPDPEAPNPGTTTPTVPTLSVQGEYKAFVLRWERQTNLTNFDEYEVQVSNDDATWYSLSFSGSDWKATLDATTPWASELLVHPNLPFGGTPEAPTALTLYYRVRRVTKEPVASSWSSSASATNLRIETGDIAADAITANKIDVSDLSAINADLGTITAGTIRSEDWGTADGCEIDLSTGRIRLGGSSAPDVDLDPDAGTYSFTGSVFSGTTTGARTGIAAGVISLYWNNSAILNLSGVATDAGQISSGTFSGGYYTRLRFDREVLSIHTLWSGGSGDKIIFASGWRPNVTGEGFLGTSSYRWGDVYSTRGNFSSTVTTGRIEANSTVDGNGNAGTFGEVVYSETTPDNTNAIGAGVSGSYLSKIRHRRANGNQAVFDYGNASW